MDRDWDKAARLVVETFRAEQREDGTSPYSFSREHSMTVGLAQFYGKGAQQNILGSFIPSSDLQTMEHSFLI